RLEADVVTPARAAMEARQADARGKAAKMLEDGKATAAVLRQMIATWEAAGENARDIFLMQKLQPVMASLVETIQSVKVDRLSVLPAGSALSGGAQLAEQARSVFGLDVVKLLQGVGAAKAAPELR